MENILTNPAAIAFILGVLAATCIYFIQKNNIDSFIELRRLRKEAASYVYQIAGFTTNYSIESIDIDEPDKLKRAFEIDQKLKEYAAEINACIYNMDGYSFFSFLNLLPPKEDMIAAAGSLNKISYFKAEDCSDISEEINDFSV